MTRGFEYTTLANRYTARFPFLTYVGTQVNFWILANLFLFILIHFYARMIRHAFQVPADGALGPMIWIGVIFGLVYGVILGVVSYYAEKTFFRHTSIGKVILFKALISIALLFLFLWLLRYIFFDRWIAPTLELPSMVLNDDSWRYLFFLLLTYYFVMTLMINFINQVNKKYGPGILIPLLLGRYRNPKEQERIFMFMDLKSSTSIAEKLGHLEYSAFIRDCFTDVNDVLYPFRAQIYQYVGDEVVVTWPSTEGLNDQLCIRFYFACKEQIQSRSKYYLSHYGVLPEFKAGVHIGMVTAVEIGQVRKDIAYHGDTLNTAARIQSVCNEYKKSLLVSLSLLERIKADRLQVENLGIIALRGKTEKIGIASIDSII
ncbi:MAG: adenylate/guanylate cyclase domain-containing protein [Cyclobacteriaceae bacterium]